MRNDVIIENRVIGRILGKGARDLSALKSDCGIEVFIIDKDVPPGEGPDHRLLILIGPPAGVRAANRRLEKVFERAQKELSPIAPPLSSGLRPVPSISLSESQSGWISIDGAVPDTAALPPALTPVPPAVTAPVLAAAAAAAHLHSADAATPTQNVERDGAPDASADRIRLASGRWEATQSGRKRSSEEISADEPAGSCTSYDPHQALQQAARALR